MSVCSCMKGRPHSTCVYIHVCIYIYVYAGKQLHVQNLTQLGVSLQVPVEEEWENNITLLNKTKMTPWNYGSIIPKTTATPQAQFQRQKGIIPQAKRDNPTGRKGQPHRQKGTIPEAERDNPMGRKGQLQRQKGTTPWVERNSRGRKA